VVVVVELAVVLVVLVVGALVLVLELAVTVVVLLEGAVVAVVDVVVVVDATELRKFRASIVPRPVTRS
jgi:hypothetical protein